MDNDLDRSFSSQSSDQAQIFQEILRIHSASLSRLCAVYERSLPEQKDLMQEILLAIWKSLSHFRGDSSLRTWIFRVAHNVAITHVGRAQRKPQSTDSGIETHDSGSWEFTIEQTRKLDIMRKEIALLKPLDRQVILLYLEDIPQAEIAEITGLSITNVSTRLHRIKSQLKGAISK